MGSEDTKGIILEALPHAVYLYDMAAGRNLYSNRHLAHLIGWSAEELEAMGSRLMEVLLHPEDRTSVEHHIQAFRNAASEEVRTVRYRMRDPAGAYRWLESRETPFRRDEAGAVRVLLGTALDVTEQVEADRKLKEREAEFRMLAENTREIICRHALDGTYLYVSPVVTELLGYQPEEMLGASAYAFFHPDEAERIRTEAHLPVGQGRTDVPAVRYRLRRKDGTWAIFETTARPVFEDGQVVGIQSVSRDVTEQRKLETRLEAAERLRAVAQLAAGVAHDFNNVLTAVQANLELLQEESSAQERRLLTQEALEQVERAALLTRRLLAVGQSDPSVRSRPLEVSHAVVEISDLLRRLLQVDIRPGGSTDEAWACIDRGGLEQVLLNLVINARDASPSTPVEVGVEATSTHIAVVVRDEGPGIPTDDLDRVFEPFFTTKPQGQGTGLGLSTVKAIVEAGQGTVGVAIRPSGGTEVRCVWPRSDGLPGPVGTEAPEEVQPQVHRVLVVDDQAPVLRAASRILRSGGFEVSAVTSGAEALLRLRQTPAIHVLVSDVFMPGLDGPSLVETARAEGRCPPVIFMTGYVPGGSVTESLQALGAPILHKPFPAHVLLDAVRACAQGEASSH